LGGEDAEVSSSDFGLVKDIRQTLGNYRKDTHVGEKIMVNINRKALNTRRLSALNGKSI
jgi:hypothetical protein